MNFIPSCLKCLKRIENGQGSVLSCRHFVCDNCAYQPEQCPICDEPVQAESLLNLSSTVVDFIVPPVKALEQVIQSLQFQGDHHNETLLRYNEESARQVKKMNDLNRMLCAERVELGKMKGHISTLEKEVVRLRSIVPSNMTTGSNRMTHHQQLPAQSVNSTMSAFFRSPGTNPQLDRTSNGPWTPSQSSHTHPISTTRTLIDCSISSTADHVKGTNVHGSLHPEADISATGEARPPNSQTLQQQPPTPQHMMPPLNPSTPRKPNILLDSDCQSTKQSFHEKPSYYNGQMIPSPQQPVEQSTQQPMRQPPQQTIRQSPQQPVRQSPQQLTRQSPQQPTRQTVQQGSEVFRGIPQPHRHQQRVQSELIPSSPRPPSYARAMDTPGEPRSVYSTPQRSQIPVSMADSHPSRTSRLQTSGGPSLASPSSQIRSPYQQYNIKRTHPGDAIILNPPDGKTFRR